MTGTPRSCYFATASDRFTAQMCALDRTAWTMSAPGSPSINASNADASAVARKLAVTTHAMLRSGEMFDRTAGIGANLIDG